MEAPEYLWDGSTSIASNPGSNLHSALCFASRSIVLENMSISVSVCNAPLSSTMYPALSSISNGVIHPGLSSGCGLTLTMLAESPCAGDP
jgi:hypothetical protein